MSSGADVADGGECACGAEYAEHCHCNSAEALGRGRSWVRGLGCNFDSSGSTVGIVGRRRGS